MQLSRLQKIDHSGSGPRGVFFLRRMADADFGAWQQARHLS